KLAPSGGAICSKVIKYSFVRGALLIFRIAVAVYTFSGNTILYTFCANDALSDNSASNLKLVKSVKGLIGGKVIILLFSLMTPSTISLPFSPALTIRIERISVYLSLVSIARGSSSVQETKLPKQIIPHTKNAYFVI